MWCRQLLGRPAFRAEAGTSTHTELPCVSVFQTRFCSGNTLLPDFGGLHSKGLFFTHSLYSTLSDLQAVLTLGRLAAEEEDPEP